MWHYNHTPPTDELYHHGIKGMKWGVRRSQAELDRLAGRVTGKSRDRNEDGSLTDRAVKKYARAGYAQDSYNANKTAIGKVYDKVTDAHKIYGDAMYNLSTKDENRARAEQYLKEKDASKKPKKSALERLREKYPLADNDADELREIEGIPDKRKTLDEVTEALNELNGYAQNPSKLGASKISARIRNAQIKALEKEKGDIEREIEEAEARVQIELEKLNKKKEG